jgi:hypothetical protein
MPVDGGLHLHFRLSAAVFASDAGAGAWDRAEALDGRRRPRSSRSMLLPHAPRADDPCAGRRRRHQEAAPSSAARPSDLRRRLRLHLLAAPPDRADVAADLRAQRVAAATADAEHVAGELVRTGLDLVRDVELELTEAQLAERAHAAGELSLVEELDARLELPLARRDATALVARPRHPAGRRRSCSPRRRRGASAWR